MHPGCFRFGQRSLDGRFHLAFVQGGLSRRRDHHQDSRGQPGLPMRQRNLRRFPGGVGPLVHGQAAVAGVKSGESVCPVADHRHPLRLQHLPGGRQVQDGFGPRADHQHRGFSQLRQVR